MRLHKLVLENYIGIYNGMGLTDILLDFSKCRHKILVIKGDNGSGKSTVYRALNPLNDPSSEFIVNKDGKKVIEYLLDDNSLLTIAYFSQAAYDKNTQRWYHKPAKCSILRTFQNSEPIELNPSGNVTSGKEIIYDLLQLDENFLILSALSSTNKGIGALRPSDRKRYVNEVISSLGEFITINKMLTKKAGTLKSMLNSLTAKLDQIGNIERVIDQLKKDQETLQELESLRTSLIESIAVIKKQIDEINKDGDLLELHIQLESKLSRLREEVKNLNQSTIYDESKVRELEKMLIEVNTKLSIYKDRLEKLLKDETSSREDIDNAKYKLQAYKDIGNYTDICSRLIDIEQQISIYEEELEKIGFKHYKSIDVDQYSIALDSIEYINETIYSLHSKYDMSIISNAVRWIYTKVDDPLDENILDSLITRASMMLDEIKRQERLKDEASVYDSIPESCPNKNTCPFISTVIKAKLELWTPKDLEEYIQRREAVLNDIEKTKSNILLYQQTMACKEDLEQFVSSILRQGVQIPLTKFFNHSILSNTKEILDRVLNILPIDIDTHTYWDHMNCMKMITSLSKDKDTLSRDKLTYENSNHEITILRNQQESAQLTLENVLASKQKLLDDIGLLTDKQVELNRSIDDMNRAKEYKERYESIIKELEETEGKDNELSNRYIDLQSLTEEYKKQKDKLSNLISNNIPLVSNQIEKAKYQLTIYSQYKEDFDHYVDMFNKLQQVREYSSINGIQAVYIEAFLNSMLRLTNELLALLFGGRFMIKEFRVNENEFSIPCIDSNGQERQDIADMSDSQLSMISMIISFVLLHQSSECYNIIKLDEVDGSLDNTNRLQFATLINKIIDMLNFHQCVIISHNNEIDLTQVDMMLFRIEKREELSNLLSSGSNVIFCYNK